MRAGVLVEIERRRGAQADDGRADTAIASEEFAGPSAILAMLCASWQDVQKARLASEQRGLDSLGESLKKIEDSTARQVKKELMAQPVWPWLSQYPGLGGVHVARLVAMIGDPRRFPGQKCSEGHTSLPDYAVGDPCPVEGMDGTTCPGTMLVPRSTTGVRALWHYLGLHVGDDGKMPRKRKGHRIDWNGEGRTICLMPGGLAEQIVRLRVPTYRDKYDAAKARLNDTRAVEVGEIAMTLGPLVEGAEPRAEIGRARGSLHRPDERADHHRENGRWSGAQTDGTEAEKPPESESCPGLRPIEIEKRARIIAVKAFVGDLLMAMKRAENGSATGTCDGAQEDGRAEEQPEIEARPGSAIFPIDGPPGEYMEAYGR